MGTNPKSLSKSPIFILCFLSNYHNHHPCLLAAFDSVGLSTREASHRQCRLEGLRSHDMECHSNNQLLWGEEGRSDHPSTFARMVLPRFHWVPLEPSSCRLELSDHASRKRLKTTSARSKPVLVMELSAWPDSEQTRSLRHCLSSPVLRPEICSTLELGPKS